jgi:hypothetical protein
MPIAMANGMKHTPAHDVLHVETDQHGQGEHHPTGHEDRGKGGQPVAVEEQVERHDRVLCGALDDGERHKSY